MLQQGPTGAPALYHAHHVAKPFNLPANRIHILRSSAQLDICCGPGQALRPSPRTVPERTSTCILSINDLLQPIWCKPAGMILTASILAPAKPVLSCYLEGAGPPVQHIMIHDANTSHQTGLHVCQVRVRPNVHTCKPMLSLADCS